MILDRRTIKFVGADAHIASSPPRRVRYQQRKVCTMARCGNSIQAASRQRAARPDVGIGLLRAEHMLDQTGEQDGHECNQPEPLHLQVRKNETDVSWQQCRQAREGRRAAARTAPVLHARMVQAFDGQRGSQTKSAEAKAQQKGDGITHGLTGWPSGPEYEPGGAAAAARRRPVSISAFHVSGKCLRTHRIDGVAVVRHDGQTGVWLGKDREQGRQPSRRARPNRADPAHSSS